MMTRSLRIVDIKYLYGQILSARFLGFFGNAIKRYSLDQWIGKFFGNFSCNHFIVYIDKNRLVNKSVDHHSTRKITFIVHDFVKGPVFQNPGLRQFKMLCNMNCKAIMFSKHQSIQQNIRLHVIESENQCFEYFLTTQSFNLLLKSQWNADFPMSNGIQHPEYSTDSYVFVWIVCRYKCFAKICGTN